MVKHSVGLITIQPEEFATRRLQIFLGLQITLFYTARRLNSKFRFPLRTWIHDVFVIYREFRGIVMGQALV
jgi:hypothetical protein